LPILPFVLANRRCGLLVLLQRLERRLVLADDKVNDLLAVVVAEGKLTRANGDRFHWPIRSF